MRDSLECGDLSPLWPVATCRGLDGGSGAVSFRETGWRGVSTTTR